MPSGQGVFRAKSMVYRLRPCCRCAESTRYGASCQRRVFRLHHYDLQSTSSSVSMRNIPKGRGIPVRGRMALFPSLLLRGGGRPSNFSSYPVLRVQCFPSPMPYGSSRGFRLLLLFLGGPVRTNSYF